jgi:hypothetical protein
MVGPAVDSRIVPQNAKNGIQLEHNTKGPWLGRQGLGDSVGQGAYPVGTQADRPPLSKGFSKWLPYDHHDNRPLHFCLDGAIILGTIKHLRPLPSSRRDRGGQTPMATPSHHNGPSHARGRAFVV